MDTMIEDYDISLGVELADLSQSDLFSFLLGARRLTPSLPDYDSPELHLLNLNFIRDVAAVYDRTTCTRAFKKRDRHVNSTGYLLLVNVSPSGIHTK